MKLLNMEEIHCRSSLEEIQINYSLEDNSPSPPLKENRNSSILKENQKSPTMEEKGNSPPLEENQNRLPLGENQNRRPLEENENYCPLEENLNRSLENPKSHKEIAREYSEGQFSKEYVVLQKIGRGAYGYVALTTSTSSNGELYVAKFIRKNALRKKFLNGFGEPNEVEVLRKLNHESIIKLESYYTNDKYHQLVFKKLDIGIDLYDFNTLTSQLVDEPLAAYIFKQILNALIYLRGKGLVHRDIKDENVLINDKFMIKLIDFGAVIDIEDDNVQLYYKEFPGTKDYASPQVLNQQYYNVLSEDIYAFGFMLYITIYLDPPFRNAAQKTDDVTFPSDHLSSDELKSLIKGMLHRETKRRFKLNDIASHKWFPKMLDIFNIDYYDFYKFSPREKMYAWSKSRNLNEFDVILKEEKRLQQEYIDKKKAEKKQQRELKQSHAANRQHNPDHADNFKTVEKMEDNAVEKLNMEYTNLTSQDDSSSSR